MKKIGLVLLVVLLAFVGWKQLKPASKVVGTQVKVEATEAQVNSTLTAKIAEQVTLLAAEARQVPATPEQNDLLSKSLPSLPWKQVEHNLSKARLQALSKQAQALVVGVLKDPESVRFKDPKFIAVADSAGPRQFVCGQVNSKNSFGGYVGFQTYIFELKGDSSLQGGVGDEGGVAGRYFDERWWRYDADDACFTNGTPIE